jgi:UDPglucose 6-dehydrogenase/GDP-mannose 6-dehydrogenase
MNVSIVGAGYVGLVTGLCLAERGHSVICVDVDTAKIEGLRAGLLPLHEPGLEALLRAHLGARFRPSTDLPAAVAGSELTMITVGTPINRGAIDLQYVRQAAAEIGRALAHKPGYHVVVVKSTVVPGTTDEVVTPVLEQHSGKSSGRDFGVGMNPEFLREGEAVDDFRHPDRIVLGANDPAALDVMSRLYDDFVDATQVHTNTRTAEMIKYASNALLATLISFSNEIGNLCAAAGAVDVVDVLDAVHLDKRISPITEGRRVTPPITAYLKAGCGFGGSCFPKDVRALIRWSEQRHRPARVLSAVLETNDEQPHEIVRLLHKRLHTLAGSRIAVLGLAFKPNTDDIRESPALTVIPALMAEGAVVVAHDPVANAPAQKALGPLPVEYATTLEAAVAGVDAVVLLTAWPEFRRLPELVTTGPEAPIVVDGRRLFDKSRMSKYEGIGLSDDRSPVAQASFSYEAAAGL